MMRLLALLAATTSARLYTPRLFPPTLEPPLPPVNQEACDAQERRERRWARSSLNTTCAPLGATCTNTAGCCVTGAPPIDRARRWVAARREGYILASLATSDARCAAEATVRNLLAHTTDVLVVVHRGCGAEALANEDRMVQNPVCVPTRRAFGSLLHAHLQNVLYAHAVFDTKPTHVLLTAANLYWLAPGVERYIRLKGSSVYDAARVPVSARGIDPDWAAIRRRLPFGDAALQQKHEGSFYPYASLLKLVAALAAKGLGRLNHRTCFCGGFCIEEFYLPNLFFLLAQDAPRFKSPAGTFDAKAALCYVRHNPDLNPGYCGAGTCDAEGLYNHWAAFGRCEGRSLACDAAEVVEAGPAPVTVFYNVFATDTESASAIVKEQLHQLREAPLWSFVKEIRYATIGPEAAIGTEVAGLCTELGATCVHLGHTETGDEPTTLTPLHAFCRAHPKAAVAYLHDKGSFHDSPPDARLRQILLRGLASQPCVATITRPSACDVCSTRFTMAPHQHTSSNMWLAKCSYITKLHEPRDFGRRMELHYGRKKGGDAWPLGTWRFAYEHWVHSHPALQACDVLDHPFQEGYRNLPPLDFPISFALAPRYQRGHEWYGDATSFRGRPAAFSLAERGPEMMSEWRALYNATPPPASRLRTYYGGRACARGSTNRREDFLFAGTAASRDRVRTAQLGRTKFAVKHRAHNDSCARGGR